MKSLVALIIAGGLATTPAFADCPYPAKLPSDAIPNGATAQLDQMKAAIKAANDYILAITEYSECLTKETDETVAKPDVSEDQKKAAKTMTDQKIAAALAESKAVENRMKEQREAYLKAHPKKGS